MEREILVPPTEPWFLLQNPGSSYRTLVSPAEPWFLLQNPGSSCRTLVPRGPGGELLSSGPMET
ncbi:hypothetical protein EYF80_065367 [Liparis tanakae]|uniref:Uncharacterized protein n=1 Tax=Liparis tanakae TaxID=230148 RepID=A0A4Z2E6W8_9TELE|nr:hypothetical protein EYF80_065367 [Liparis tanakae]